MIDLDDNVEVWANVPALVAELRAARMCTAMLRQAYDCDAVREWFDEEGPAGLAALEKYDAVTGNVWATKVDG